MTRRDRRALADLQVQHTMSRQVVEDLSSKLQFLINHLDLTFTFPDGDTWWPSKDGVAPKEAP